MWCDAGDTEACQTVLLQSMDEGITITASQNEAVSVTKHLLQRADNLSSKESQLATLILLNQLLEEDNTQRIRCEASDPKLLSLLLNCIDDVLHSEQRSLHAGPTECPILTVQTCVVSLKILWHLSSLPIGQQQMLITEPIIRRLVAFTDQNNHHTFGYSKEMMAKVRESIGGKMLFGQVRKEGLNSDITAMIHRLTPGDDHIISNSLTLQSVIYRCVLYDTTDPNHDVNIVHSLIDQGLAWPVRYKHKEVKPELEDTGVYVLHTIQGPLFWAYVGDVKIYIETMQHLHKVMLGLIEDLPPFPEPLVGSHVIVMFVTGAGPDSSVQLYRGVITRMMGDNCDVFAADLGAMLTDQHKSMLYQLPDQAGYRNNPALASICILEGIEPPCRFPLLTQLSVACLVNLCRYSVPAGEMVIQSLSGLELVAYLTMCPDRRISIQACQLLNNLGCNCRLNHQLPFTHLIHILSDLLKLVISTHDMDEVEVDQTEACIITLTTLLTVCSDNREAFYKHNHGLNSLLVLLASTSNLKLFKASTKLLRVFLWDAPLAIGSRSQKMETVLKDRSDASDAEGQRSRQISKEKTIQRRSPKSAINLKRSMSLGRLNESQERKNFEVKLSERRLTRSDSDDDCQTDLFLKIPREKETRKLYGDSHSSTKEYPNSPPKNEVNGDVEKVNAQDTDLAIIMSMGTTLQQARIALELNGSNAEKACDWVIQNAEWLMEESGEITLNSPIDSLQTPTILPVEMCANQVTSDKYYIVDSYVDFDHDAEHEIRPNMSIKHASSDIISQIACGFLNTGKPGLIVFGVCPDGKVHGVNLTRDDKDQFRLGVDRMLLDKLQPTLMHSMYDVSYCSVVRPQGHADPQTRSPLPNVFVVELRLKASSGELYTLTSGHCFYRSGSKTIKLKSQDLRELIVMEEEEICLNKIKKLQSQLTTLKRVVAQQSNGDK